MSSATSTGFAGPAVPVVSVIMPVYNGLPFILATIDSVRRQTCRNWELTICDSGSSDGTAAQVRDYLQADPDPRIRLVVLEKSPSMGDDWNRALTYARGEFVKVLPQDDLLLPTCLEVQERLLRQHPDVGFVTCAKEVIDAAGCRLFRRAPLKEGVYDWHQLGVRSLRAVANNLGEPGAILFRRDLLTTCGNFDAQLRYFIDLELLWRLLRVSHVFVWGEPLYQFRIHGRSVRDQPPPRHRGICTPARPLRR